MTPTDGGPAMNVLTLVRLAIAGRRTDRVRIVLTAIASTGATLACLCAATLAAIPTNPVRFGDDTTAYHSSLLTLPGLRAGVITALLILTIPFLALAAQCARLGAPARDRRIAAMRLAGATPGQARAIGAGETGLAALLGSAIAVTLYLVARPLLDDPDARGVRQLPTDVLPPTGVIVAICLGLPVLGALLAAVLLRNVITSPFGVVRRAPARHAPRPWPAALIAGGLVVAVLIRFSYLFIASDVRIELLRPVLYAGVICVTLGVVLSAGWLSYALGRIVHRHARRAAPQIAAARLMADPWAFSRTLGVLLIAALIGGIAAGLYAMINANARLDTLASRASGDGTGSGGHPAQFYTHAFALVDAAIAIGVVVSAFSMAVALVETITSRRRAYASLVATGVPRDVLGRASMWQMMIVAVPSVILTVALGDLLMRTVIPTRIGEGPSDITVSVAVPWANLAGIVAVALGAIAAMVGVSLLFLRASTDVGELRTA